MSTIQNIDLQLIKETVCGSVDMYFNNNYTILNDKINQIKNTFESPITYSLKHTNASNRYIYKIHVVEGIFITSIKSDKIKLIDSITLLIQGTQYDKLEGFMIPTLQEKFNFENNEIPFLILKKFIFGDVKIIINYIEKVDNDSLHYNYCKGPIGLEIEMCFLCSQYRGEEDSSNVFSLNYNFIIPY